jgi:hypothetical protein
MAGIMDNILVDTRVDHLIRGRCRHGNRVLENRVLRIAGNFLVHANCTRELSRWDESGGTGLRSTGLCIPFSAFKKCAPEWRSCLEGTNIQRRTFQRRRARSQSSFRSSHGGNRRVSPIRRLFRQTAMVGTNLLQPRSAAWESPARQCRMAMVKCIDSALADGTFCWVSDSWSI